MASASSTSTRPNVIVDALRTTFKDADGNPLPNERIAQLLLENMHELVKLVQQGKISSAQIEQLQEFAHKHAAKSSADASSKTSTATPAPDA
ncbi:unnamed protein product [Peniophora sp. CBMAI 1063]|nr:unnamed protein product [Peniophora sp. CBMAI 1063]